MINDNENEAENEKHLSHRYNMNRPQSVFPQTMVMFTLNSNEPI